jgi:hypothetical protein
LTDERIYRDLSIPVAAMNEERLEQDRALMSEITDDVERCLYRFHYSNAGMVIGFLMRMEPFTTLHIAFQGGRFDYADRLFNAIPYSWQSVTGTDHDYRELIPEFYCLPEFLENRNGFDLGKMQHGETAADVTLPAWCSTSFEFIQVHRQALESEYVRNHLNEWIDLIFGCYQSSLEKNNLYHLYSYQECMERGLDDDQKMMAKRFCANFGTCPTKLLTKQHLKSLPPVVNPELSEFELDNNPTQILYFDRLVVLDQKGEVQHLASNTKTTHQIQQSEYLQILYVERPVQFIFLHKHGGFVTITRCERDHIAHSGSSIRCMAQIDNEFLVTAGNDYLIYIWTVPTFDLLGTIPIQSTQIISIDGSRALNAIVCMNAQKQVFVCWFFEMKSVWSFNTELVGDWIHRVCVLSNGMIAVSCESIGSRADENNKVVFFDFQGRKIGEALIDGKFVKMIPISTKAAENYLVVSTAKKKVFVVNCDNCKLHTVLEGTAFPDLVAAIDDTKRLVVVTPRKPKKARVVHF